MASAIRAQRHAHDYPAVNDLLIETNASEGTGTDWLRPLFESMHTHEAARNLPADQFAAAAVDGTVVGITHLEHNCGSSFRMGLWPGNLGRSVHRTGSYRPHRAPILTDP